MTGAGVRDIRQALGLSQAELAKQMAIAPNTVARWEHAEDWAQGRQIPASMAEFLRCLVRLAALARVLSPTD